MLENAKAAMKALSTPFIFSLIWYKMYGTAIALSLWREVVMTVRGRVVLG